jgi:MraZ protein
MSAAPSKPIIYNSSVTHALDKQRRVQVPAMWRPEESGTEFTMILWPKHAAGECLRVLPPDKMQKLMADIDAMPNSDPNKVYLKRFIGSNSVQVALDSAGRICIPEEMKKAAGIGDEAVFVGLLDRFEIWSTDRHTEVKRLDATRSSAAFEMME